MSRHGKVVFKEAYGFADFSFGVPNTIETKFRLASVTKPITALAILKLSEIGKLNIDDPVKNYLPGFGENITVKSLLKHRSGLPREVTVLSGKGMETNFTLEEIVSLARNSTLAFEPNSRFSYSNLGYSVLAAVIEKVTGKSYQEAIKELVLMPLRMNNTINEPTPEIIKSKANGYVIFPDGIFPAPYENKSYVIGAGSLTSTADDLLNLLDFLEQSKDFSQKTKDLFFREVADSRTMGMISFDYKTIGEKYPLPLNGKAVFHTGTCPGFETSIVKYLEHQISIVILSNQTGIPVQSIFNDIGNLMLGLEVKPPVKLNHDFYRQVLALGAENYFQKLNQTNSLSSVPKVNEINRMGYNYFRSSQIDKAIEIFLINTLIYPKDANTFDSLGEAYLAKNFYELALVNYKKSVELNPNNQSGKKVVERIEELLKRMK